MHTDLQIDSCFRPCVVDTSARASPIVAANICASEQDSTSSSVELWRLAGFSSDQSRVGNSAVCDPCAKT